jgi:hypothetical protein
MRVHKRDTRVAETESAAWIGVDGVGGEGTRMIFESCSQELQAKKAADEKYRRIRA